MISYFLNWMGPINKDWIEKNGSCWSAGRIDVSGTFDQPFGKEYAVSPMRNEDWEDLSCWLDEFETNEVWSFEDLIAQYEQERNTKIRWLDNEK